MCWKAKLNGASTGSGWSRCSDSTSPETLKPQKPITMKKHSVYPMVLTATLILFCTTGCEKEENEDDQANAGSVFNPSLEYGTLTDQDGNIYKTIQIGDQEWMAENLRTATYVNGDPIPNVTDEEEWSDIIPSSTGAWVHFDNDSQHESPYGKLYNWYCVVDARNLCPSGWHVPSDPEWTALLDHLGGAGSVAGKKMKSTGTQYWTNPYTDATNESGFSGLPGGFRLVSGSFLFMGSDALWWSSTQNIGNVAWACYLDYEIGAEAGKSIATMAKGLSVRCLKD